MELKQRQYRILIVSAQPKFNDSLEKIISERRHFEHEIQNSAAAARRRLVDRSFDIVLINAPLPDENGVRLAADRSSDPHSTVLLIIPNEFYGEVFSTVCRQGIYTLPKPFSPQLFRQALDWLESTCERFGLAEKRSTSLENKMNEIKLVNRAKLLLISVYGLTEEEAHRRIEKTAMDRGMKKGAVAEEIIAMNDNSEQV